MKRNIELTEIECISVQHILSYYAYQNSTSLDSEDKISDDGKDESNFTWVKSYLSFKVNDVE